jgi:hypothetical protein
MPFDLIRYMTVLLDIGLIDHIGDGEYFQSTLIRPAMMEGAKRDLLTLVVPGGWRLARKNG